MPPIPPSRFLDERHLEWHFIRASGPGGQNVNKVSSAVQLRFDAAAAVGTGTIRERLNRLAGRRMTSDGVLVIDARRYRSQEMNRADALDRLTTLLRNAERPPKPRRKTRPPKAAKERRLESKHLRATTKRRRGALKGLEG